MDFDWPLGVVWGGYLNPYHHQATKCTACDGSGYGPEAKRFRDEWYGYAPFCAEQYGAVPVRRDSPGITKLVARNYPNGTARQIEGETDRLYRHFSCQWGYQLVQVDVDALVAADRLWDFTRVPITAEQRAVVAAKVAAGGNSWLPEANGHHPTAEEVNKWAVGGIGHDGLNQHICVRARCEREGVEVECPVCAGTGERWPSKEIEDAAETWTCTEPPAGPGYQLWENTTEGSPQSPVFATLRELAEWCQTGATTFGHQRATAEEWYSMLDDGLVCHQAGNSIFI